MRRRAASTTRPIATSTRMTAGLESLATEPATTASTERASVSVMTVPPPATPTARSRRRPCSWTIGYATSVCEAQSDPKSIAVAKPYPNGSTSAIPRTNGSVNVNAPNVMAARRLAWNSSRSSSRPARNMSTRIPRSPSDSTTPSRSTQPSTNGPTRSPPRIIPTRPGRPIRSTSSGPRRMTAVETKNVHSADVAGTRSRAAPAESPARFGRNLRTTPSRDRRSARRRA